MRLEIGSLWSSVFSLMKPSEEGCAANFSWPVAGDSGLIFAFDMLRPNRASRNAQAKSCEFLQLSSRVRNGGFLGNKKPVASQGNHGREWKASAYALTLPS